MFLGAAGENFWESVFSKGKITLEKIKKESTGICFVKLPGWTAHIERSKSLKGWGNNNVERLYREGPQCVCSVMRHSEVSDILENNCFFIVMWVGGGGHSGPALRKIRLIIDCLVFLYI